MLMVSEIDPNNVTNALCCVVCVCPPFRPSIDHCRTKCACLYIATALCPQHDPCSMFHCVPVLFCWMSLAEDNSSNVSDHFLRLRRQWASKASYLRANLNKITTVDMTTIIGKAASWRVTSCVSTEGSE